MIRATLVAEYRKVVTTRLWWVLLLAMAGYMAFLAAVLAWTFSQSPADTGDAPLTPTQTVQSVYTVGSALGYVFPLVVGAIAMASEFRHKTITPTFLAEPRRTVFLVGKLVAGLVMGVVFGVVGTVASAGAGAVVLGVLGKPTLLGEASTWRMLALSVVALALWALVGVGVGTVLTNQVAVIVVVLAWTQFVEAVLRLALGATTWGQDVAKFLPGAASDALTGGSIYSQLGDATVLAWWAGLLVMLAYVAVFAVVGRLTTLRRDIT